MTDRHARFVRCLASRTALALTALLSPSGAEAQDESVIDVAVFYTPAALEAEGGTAAIEAVIDLMVAETNQAYAESGVIQRLALAARAETSYTESGSSGLDLDRFSAPADGYMDEVHTIRNRVQADLVHLITGGRLASICGIAWIMTEASTAFSSSAFGLTHHRCGGRTFAHELGHNMGLAHDRFVACGAQGCSGAAHPYGYGYVNQQAFDAGAPESARWRTLMAYNAQCREAGFYCEGLLRFSNPTQTRAGDPLGVPGDSVSSSLIGPSDAVRSLNDTRGIVENFRRGTDVDSPDLVVGLSSVGDTTTAPGRSVTLSATVRNHGASTAPATSLTYYRVSGGSVTREGTAPVDSLASGGADTARFDVTAPSNQGVHYYFATVDSVQGELDVHNNGSNRVYARVVVPSCTTSLGALSGTVTRSGSWDGSCPSAYYPYGEYARYYTFTLGRAARVTIDLTSPSVDTWLALRGDAGFLAVDNDGGTGANARLALELEAGAYTVEATTLLGGVTGPFTLTLHAESVAGGDDRAALEALYNATNGPGWTNRTNWLTGARLPEWFGVTTDGDRVTALDLSGNGLSGSIPPALGNLTALQRLHLGSRQDVTSGQRFYNALSGFIPAELARLTDLRLLSLGDNQLTGAIPPELARLVNLQELVLENNVLSGSIPAELARLANLESLALDRNALSGPIPQEIGQLTNLRGLSLHANALSGSLPPGLAQLTRLERMSLGANALSGPIPPALAQLVNLQWLLLANNALTGPIPAELGQLTNLEGLSLAGNELTGPFEPLGNLTNLRLLWLWELGLTGPIPAWLADLSSLDTLHLGRNALSGPIPAWLGNLSDLRHLYLFENPVTGLVPPSLTQTPLRTLWIHETRVCVPAEPAFQTWRETIGNFRGAICGEDLTDEQYERYRRTWQEPALENPPPVDEQAVTAGFTDHPLVPGRTPLRTAHLRELRERIAVLRVREGLPAVEWTDPTLAAGVTPVRSVHLTQLRAALDAVYDAVARPRPSYTDAMVAGATAVKAVHLMELRGAVLALE